MDVRDMIFENDSFEVIMDKAFLDCIFCGNHAFKNVDKCLI